jgi:predicted DNA-binding transcriptional regulator AlpA
MDEVLLTFQELCTFLKADEEVVLSLIESGSLPPPLNIGDRLIRWAEGDLARWLQMGCPKYPPPVHEELTLIRTKHLEEKLHASADVDAKVHDKC